MRMSTLGICKIKGVGDVDWGMVVKRGGRFLDRKVFTVEMHDQRGDQACSCDKEGLIVTDPGRNNMLGFHGWDAPSTCGQGW